MTIENIDLSASAKVAVTHADAILAAAKRLKAVRKKHDALQGGESIAREKVRELMKEAHEITGAMVNATDKDEEKTLMERNKQIQKELAKANNRVDKAIDKAHGESEAIEAAYRELMDAINGNVTVADEPVPAAEGAEQEEQEEKAAGATA